MKYDKIVWIPFWVLVLMMILGTMMIYNVKAELSDMNMTQLEEFLVNDTTDEHKYLPWYTCGHFARDLARNASDHNISIGSAIVSSHPVFRGKWNSHIINYVYIDDELVFIDAQYDVILCLDDIFFKWEYIRLYPDGTQVPSNWDNNIAPSISYDKYCLE